METLQQIINKQAKYEVDHFELFSRPNHVYQCNYHSLKNITFWHFLNNSDKAFTQENGKENVVGVWRIKYKKDGRNS